MTLPYCLCRLCRRLLLSTAKTKSIVQVVWPHCWQNQRRSALPEKLLIASTFVSQCLLSAFSQAQCAGWVVGWCYVEFLSRRDGSYGQRFHNGTSAPGALQCSAGSCTAVRSVHRQHMPSTDQSASHAPHPGCPWPSVHAGHHLDARSMH